MRNGRTEKVNGKKVNGKTNGMIRPGMQATVDGVTVIGAALNTTGTKEENGLTMVVGLVRVGATLELEVGVKEEEVTMLIAVQVRMERIAVPRPMAKTKATVKQRPRRLL